MSALKLCALRLPVTLLHGPPGTGKTSTLAAAVLSAVKNEDKVLFCTVLYCTVLYYIVLYCTVLYRYWDGITDNLELMPSHYPGWVMRLYVSSKNLSIGAVTSLCSLQCSQPQFDLCPVIDQPLKSGGWRLTEVFGMIWRFLPVLDPSVDVMVSREQDYIQHYRQHCHCQCLAHYRQYCHCQCLAHYRQHCHCQCLALPWSL